MENSKITGKVIKVLPLQTGAGKNGEWKKQEIIIETHGQYKKKVCVVIWGDKINANDLVEGKELEVAFDIESREYNGKWYTEVKAWKVESKDNRSANELAQANEPNLNGQETGDLPF